MRDNDSAFKELAVIISTLYMKRNRNKYTYHEGSDLTNTVAFAMNLSPDKDKIKEGGSGDKVFFSDENVKQIDGILQAIKSTGGRRPGIIIYPVLLRVYSKGIIDNVARLPIFCVRKSSSEYRFVDVNARVYKDCDDFQRLQMFPPGIIAYPRNLHYTEDSNGNAEIATLITEPPGRKALKVMDLGAGVMGIGAAGLALTGVGAPIAVGLTAVSTVYGVSRSAVTLIDRFIHEQSINPFSDWEAFGAWTGIGVTALGVGCTINAIRLSEKVSHLAADGLSISTRTRIALHASVFIPPTVNAALIITQIIRMADSWKDVPIEYKIMTGLQLLFFIGATIQLGSLTVGSIQDQVAKMVYSDMREMLAQEPDGALKIATLERMINEVGGKYNAELITTLRKIANYDNGVLFAASRDLRFAGFGTLEPTSENGEVGFRLSNRIYIGPEAAIQLGEDMRLAARDNPGVYYSVRMPRGSGNTPRTMPVNTPVDQVIASRGLVNIEQVEQSRVWLQSRLNSMENMPTLQSTFWDNMRYHDQMRLRIFPEIERSLNAGLTNLCLRYAAGDRIDTVGQYASRFEISSLVLHRRANDLIAQIEAYKAEHGCTLAEAARAFGIQTTVETETRITYNSLPNASHAFGENVSDGALKGFESRAINVVGKELVQSWKSSITIPDPKVVNTATGSLQTLASDIISLGDLSYGKPAQLIGNCSLLVQAESFPDGVIKKNNFPKIVLESANRTIQSCQGHISERVVDVSGKNENFRKIAFWNLDDGETAKCTVVTVDIRTGQCRIQNFTTKNITTTSRTEKNLKQAILEHYSDTYTPEKLKSEVDSLMTRIEKECKDYVGAQLIRDWENHDVTVTDIQNMGKVRFSSIEHAVCHVLKHGEIRTEAEIVSAIQEYFQKAQEVIEYSKDHPECVSSEWTQTGSARDFTFYRPLPDGAGVEKVVVLVRDSGEVIMKTYYVEGSISSAPPQKKHVVITKLEVRNADLQRFYLQMMMLIPHYGVLLPNDFEIIRNDLKDADMARNMIIIAAHHFNDKGTLKAKELSEVLNKTYPSQDNNKWNVFALPLDKRSHIFLLHYTEWYIYVRIQEKNVMMFLRDRATADSKDRSEAIEKYMKLDRTEDESVIASPLAHFSGFLPGANAFAAINAFLDTVSILEYDDVTLEMRDIARRLVKKYTAPKDIAYGMNECFGEHWIVFIHPKGEANYHIIYNKKMMLERLGKIYLIYC